MSTILTEFLEAPKESCSINEQDQKEPSSQKGLALPYAAAIAGVTFNGSSDAPTKSRYPGAFSSDEPTPFEQKATAKERDTMQQLRSDPEALRNPRDPYYIIQHEKAVHRWMAELTVAGNTNVEIAAKTGYSTVSVSNILRQPNTQLLIQEALKGLKNDVRVVLKGAALAAVNRLIKEVDNETTGSAQSRIAASNSIADRVFGKANQPITLHDGANLEELDDDEIAKRLAELDAAKSN